MNAKSPRPPHVKAVHTESSIDTLLCLHCGHSASHAPTLTLADLPTLMKQYYAFEKKHRTCRNRRPAIAEAYRAAYKPAA